MSRFELLLIFSLTLFQGSGLNGITFGNSTPDRELLSKQDTLEKQILFNGRVWRNLYYKIKGDQFLFSTDFLPGSVRINGKSFKNINIKFDIYNDEILTITDHDIILQLNKEMVDMFTLKFENKTYQFQKLEPDSLNMLMGYVNVLYKGNTSLFVKYKKEILILAVENKYDMFYPSHRIYIMKDGIMHELNSKKDFFSLLSDRKQEIKNFVKKNKIRVSRKIPESFVPVIEFYDSYSR